MKIVPVIVGPTAVGKTEVAETAVKMGFADYIISADSRKIYKGLTIGSASPGENEIKEFSYEMVAVCEPSEIFSAKDFAGRASDILTLKKGNPIVEGGSGLYLRALFEGLFDAPPVDAELRKQLKERAKKEGLENLWAELGRFDRESAMSIHKNDAVRIIRALEIYYQTGKPMRTLWKEKKKENTFSAQYVGLTMTAGKLRERIEKRARRMIEGGLPEEAALLRDRHGIETWPMNSIGYREALEYYEGVADFGTTLKKISTLTWQYARKQIVWLKKIKDVFWIDCDNISVSESAEKAMEHWKDNGL